MPFCTTFQGTYPTTDLLNPISFSTCSVCGKVIPGHHSGNLARHLKHKHAEVMSEFYEETGAPPVKVKKEVDIFISYEDGNEEGASSPVPPEPTPVQKRSRSTQADAPIRKRPRTSEQEEIVEQSTLDESVIPKKIANMTVNELVQNYVDMITCDGMPINFMEGLASSRLFNKINQGMGLAENVSSAHLKELILKQAENETERIRTLLTGVKGISLVLERTGDFLAVIAQFTSHGKTEKVFLGMVINNRLDLITKSLFELCVSYNISRNMICAIVSDDMQLVHGEVRDKPVFVPCLATLFGDAIMDAVFKEWPMIFEKLSATQKSECELVEFAAQLESLKSDPKRKKLTADEQKTLDIMTDWVNKALVVSQKISNAAECPVITDAIAAITKFWIQMNKNSSMIAKQLAKHMKANCSDQLVKYDPIRAAIFLDPRIQQLLTGADKTAAKVYLKKLHLQLNDGVGEDHHPMAATEVVAAEDTDDDDEDDLTAFLKEQSMSCGSEVQTSKIDRLLGSFTDVPLLSAKTKLLGYWETSDNDPCLKALAQVVHSLSGVAQRNLIDQRYVKQCDVNYELHGNELQTAIFLLGGNMRLL